MKDILSEVDRFVDECTGAQGEYMRLSRRNLEMAIENERERTRVLAEERRVMDDELRVLDLRKRQASREADIAVRRKRVSLAQVDQLARDEQQWTGGRRAGSPKRKDRDNSPPRRPRDFSPSRRMRDSSPPSRRQSPPSRRSPRRAV